MKTKWMLAVVVPFVSMMVHSTSWGDLLTEPSLIEPAQSVCPYTYSTTWTDEAGNTYTHDTFVNCDWTSVEIHYINGTLFGTLYTDADGNWTFLDGSGELVYADMWDDATGDYVVIFGNHATWMEFDEGVLAANQFWGSPSVYLDPIVIGTWEVGVYLMTATAADGTQNTVQVTKVDKETGALLTALSKLRADTLNAKKRLIELLLTFMQPKEKPDHIKPEKRGKTADERKNERKKARVAIQEKAALAK